MPIALNGNLWSAYLRWLQRAWLAIAGCSTAVHQAAEEMAAAASGSIGVNRPGTSASQTSLTIHMRMEAAPDLNAGYDGRGLATVIRLYHLRAEHVFMAMHYANYGNLEKEKQDMGDDLVGTRELVLVPGQTLEITEKLEGEARYFGVVALFRSPLAQHWRYAFAAPEAARSGVVLGLHACAMSATSAASIGISSANAALLVSTGCN